MGIGFLFTNLTAMVFLYVCDMLLSFFRLGIPMMFFLEVVHIPFYTDRFGRGFLSMILFPWVSCYISWVLSGWACVFWTIILLFP